MRKQIRRRHEAYVRAQSVCAEHSAFFDATPGGQKARAALATQMAEVDRLLVLQDRSIEERRGATAQSRLSRSILRDAAKTAVTIGRTVNLDPAATMRLPGNASNDELLVYSRALLERVSAHAEAFVAEGLPPDLPKRLGDGVVAFAAAREDQAASRQRFRAAAESIRQSLDAAGKTIDVLEAIAAGTADAPPEVHEPHSSHD
jgi:hypothetical protein